VKLVSQLRTRRSRKTRKMMERDIGEAHLCCVTINNIALKQR
jgi:hypothetical protein